jgi:hypothetical protein
MCCLLLGGGTTAGFLSDTLLQFLAIPALLVALWGLLNARHGRPARRAALFCLAVALVPLLQLVPLPPEIWTALPNREAIVATFQLLDPITREPPFESESHRCGFVMDGYPKHHYCSLSCLTKSAGTR